MAKRILTIVALALLAVIPASAQYDTYIWKADSLFMCGEFAQSSTMFDKAFQTGQNIDGRHLYNAACVAALAGNKEVAFKRLFARMKKEPDWYAEAIESDEDLTSLHGDARWKAMIDSFSVRQERIERNYDKPLRKRLQQLGKADQDIRQQWAVAYHAQPRNQAKVDSLLREMQRIDSLNQKEICDILDQRGFVGRQVVGEACAVFWLIIQHASIELQQKYLPQFQQAAARGDIVPSHVAMMEDRINAFGGKPQKYGSQFYEDKYGVKRLYPLLDPEKVEEWRKEVGMEPLADYLRKYGVRRVPVNINVNVVSEEVLRAQHELLLQGDSCMKEYNTFQALKYYQEAFDMAGTYEVRTKLADCHYRRGNYRQASELLKQIPEDSLSHEAFRQLANCYQKQGDVDSYIYWTQQLVHRYPMDGEMVAGLTLAFSHKNQPQKGLLYGLNYCNSYDAKNILVNRAVADAYFMERDFTTAAVWYKGLLEQGDSTFNTFYSAGMCYAQTNDLERAYDYLKAALFLSQMEHYGAAYRLGVVCIDTKRDEEGLRYLNLATELLKPDTIAMKAITLSQGEGYYHLEHYAEAIEAWKQHLSYNPSSIATYYNIANTYAYLVKDDEQAKSYYRQFLDLARKEETPNEQLLEMMEKTEEMLKYYETIENQ